ncbi:MAG: HAMP domain-containing protein, partial [Acidimicrobiales bacterium]
MRTRPPHDPDRSPQRRRRLRLRSAILLVVLIPTLGVIGTAFGSIREAMTLRDTTQQVDASAATLASIADARVVAVDERTASTVAAFAAELGVDLSTLSALIGTDYSARLQSARTAFDTNEVLAITDQERARIDQTRDAIDAGTATLDQVDVTYDPIIVRLDSLWDSHLSDLQAHLGSGDVAAGLSDRLAALRNTFALQRRGTSLVMTSTELVQSPTYDPTTAAQFFDTASRHQSAIEAMSAVLGPVATETWEQYRSDPDVATFDAVLDEIEQALLEGSAPPQLVGFTGFTGDFASAEPWVRGLNDLVGDAAQDLRDEASRQQRQATQDLQIEVATAGVLTVLALTGATLLVRSVNRPVRRLEGAADQIRKGTFTLEPIDTTGPRELADTAVAFNEMAATLASVESYATTLADEPEDPLLDHPIPGRTGQALQVALNRLRSSIRQADQRREELEVAATHDALTGLLNRSAALMM